MCVDVCKIIVICVTRTKFINFSGKRVMTHVMLTFEYWDESDETMHGCCKQNEFF